MPIPASINNAPQLSPGLELYFTAYEELVMYHLFETDRRPILWADVDRYAERHQFTPDQADALFYHIGKLEEVSLAHWREQVKRAGKGGSAKSKPVLAANAKAKQAHHRKR